MSSDRHYLYAEYPILADQVQRTHEFHANPGLRVPTGWDSIDSLIYGGVAPGEVCYILGRSHTGKSMFLLNIMINNPDVPSVLFTIEMPEHQAITRMSAMAMGEEYDFVMRQMAHDHIDWQANPLLRRDLWVVDDPVDFDQMADVIAKIKHDYHESMHPRMVCLDYLELVRSESRKDGYERAETLARDLKAWSKAIGLPVFVVHQSNMTIKRWKAPDENAARGAGYTEADLVLGVWHPASDPEVNPSREEEQTYKAKVIKNRISGALSEELSFRLNPSLTLDDPVILDRLNAGLI